MKSVLTMAAGLAMLLAGCGGQAPEAVTSPGGEDLIQLDITHSIGVEMGGQQLCAGGGAKP